jgi:antitoxin CptB
MEGHGVVLARQPEKASGKSALLHRPKDGYSLRRSAEGPQAPACGFRRFDQEMPMSGLARSTDGMEPRRKKLLFRAWHRGMREMDLIMGRFAEASLDAMSDAELDTFEQLIEAPDRDLLAWITGREPTPANYATAVFQALKAFHTHDKPVHA